MSEASRGPDLAGLRALVHSWFEEGYEAGTLNADELARRLQAGATEPGRDGIYSPLPHSRFDHDGTYRHHHDADTGDAWWWQGVEEFGGVKREHRHRAATSDVEPRPRASHDVLCPTCGAAVRVVSGDEGTSYYEPLPAPASDVEPSPDLTRETLAAALRRIEDQQGVRWLGDASGDRYEQEADAILAALHTETSGEPR